MDKDLRIPRKVRCPNPACGTVAKVPPNLTSRVVRCPRCGTTFSVTSPELVPSPFRPRSSTAALSSVGPYQIRERLGSGASGTVYLALDPALQREVALKVLRPEALDSPKTLERLKREARVVARMNHPNIVPIHDIGQTEGLVFIASAYVRGKTLASVIPEQGLDQRRAAALAVQLAEALAYAHAKGVLHRDVKPANILLSEVDELYLADFGLALCMDGHGVALTNPNALLGTPTYMAPEAAAGQNQHVGPLADQYSAGVVLYHMLTGRPPFEGPIPVVLFNAVHTSARPPSECRPELDPELEAICLKAMAKKPEDRYRDDLDFANALREWLSRAQPGSSAPPPAENIHSPLSGTMRSDETFPAPTSGQYQPLPAEYDPDEFDRDLIVNTEGEIDRLEKYSTQVDKKDRFRRFTPALATVCNYFRSGLTKNWFRALLGVLIFSTLMGMFARSMPGLFYSPFITDSQSPSSPSDRPFPFWVAYLLAAVISLVILGLVVLVISLWVPRKGRTGLPLQRSATPPRPPEYPSGWKPPPVVGGYRLGELLGRGGSADVYLGTHVILGSPAAVKIFCSNASDQSPGHQARALHEAEVLARLEHPHVVPVLNAGREEDYFFVIMKYVPGGDLTKLDLPVGKGLPLARALEIAREVAGALHYLHGHGVVHRDVKPSNVLLDNDGRALLSDFGSLKQLQEAAEGRITEEGEIVGTPAYMAPEQAQCQSITPAADLYGFGCLLYFLVTGRDVFQGQVEALVYQQVYEPPTPPRNWNPEVPEDLDRLILDLLKKKPEERPHDMAEVLRRLTAIQSGAGLAASGDSKPEAEAFFTMEGPSPNRDPRADESLFEGNAPAFGIGDEAARTIVPEEPSSIRPCPAPIRLRMEGGSPAEDRAAQALRQWQGLRDSDEAEAERFWSSLPEDLGAAPVLAEAREWYNRRQAERLFEQTREARRGNRVDEALRLVREVLALAPDHGEAGALLRELDASTVLKLDRLKALAREGKPQRVPALAAILRSRVKQRDLEDYLHSQPECGAYRDPTNLEEFLFEHRGDTRERILGDLFGLSELRAILAEQGGKAEPGTSKAEIVRLILDAIGFRRLVLPEGIGRFHLEVSVGCRGLGMECDRHKLLGMGMKIFVMAERALKDLVHFYGHWVHGPSYPDELCRRGWVPSNFKGVQRLSLGSLNQSFLSLAEEVPRLTGADKFFPESVILVPRSLANRLRQIEPHRNRVFGHDSPETRNLTVPELRGIALQVRDTVDDFFRHLQNAGVFPRKLVLDRKVEDRSGQVSYFCLSDANDEIEVITNQS